MSRCESGTLGPSSSLAAWCAAGTVEPCEDCWLSNCVPGTPSGIFGCIAAAPMGDAAACRLASRQACSRVPGWHLVKLAAACPVDILSSLHPLTRLASRQACSRLPGWPARSQSFREPLQTRPRPFVPFNSFEYYRGIHRAFLFKPLSREGSASVQIVVTTCEHREAQHGDNEDGGDHEPG